MLKPLGRDVALFALGLAPLGVIGVIVGACVWHFEGHGASLSALSGIQPGMTCSRVVSLLGHPGTINRSEEGSESWIYTRSTSCQVKVLLTPEGVVNATEHEHDD